MLYMCMLLLFKNENLQIEDKFRGPEVFAIERFYCISLNIRKIAKIRCDINMYFFSNMNSSKKINFNFKNFIF